MAVDNKEKTSRFHHKLKRSEIKRRKQEELLAGRTGVWMGQVQEPYKKTKYILLYLGNAVLNFLIVWGTIGCILESLEVEWDAVLVAPALLMAAVGMSLFYLNTMIRILGYGFVIGGFVLGVQQFMIYMRSGFAVISNKVMEVLELELDLPIERQYEVYVDNERSAVSICVFFIGVVVMLLFNIVISEFKNYWIILFFTFPVMQLPIYLNQRLPMRYMTVYIAGLLILYCLRNGGHYGVVGRKQTNYYQRKWKKEKYYLYRADGNSNMFVGLAILGLAAVVILIMQGIHPREHYDSQFRQSQWKTQSQAFAKRVALVGFYGMLYRNSDGAGGVGNGRLGNVNMVRMDYEPDLYLYTQETVGETNMYIRAFCGREYKDNQWSTERENENQSICIHFQMADEFVHLDSLDKHLLEAQEKEIRIQNVGANEQFAYIPYWNNSGVLHKYQMGTRGSEDRLRVGYYTDRVYGAQLGSYSVPQIKQIVKQVWEQENNILWNRFFDQEMAYREYVYDNYLQLEEEQRASLLNFCQENGIQPENENVVEQVQQFLRDNYTYTLMPGITPRNEDFVDYFLYTQKKGYCTYFASAAVLMFRSMGIPARYVGGYAISGEDFTSSQKMRGSNLKDWRGTQQTIQRIEVTDAKAHAWAEIYIDGFGWYPVEVTTSDSEELPQEEDNQVFTDFIGNVFGPEAVQRVRDTTRKTILWILYLLIAFSIVYMIMCICVRFWRRRSWERKENEEAVCSMFDYFCRMAEASGCKWQEGISYRQMGERIQTYYYLPSEDVERLVFLLEQARYSSIPVGNLEREWYYEKMQEHTRKMYENLEWYQKLKVRWIKRL